MTSIESDTEVAARLEFEEAQRSEGWRLLRAATSVSDSMDVMTNLTNQLALGESASTDFQ